MAFIRKIVNKFLVMVYGRDHYITRLAKSEVLIGSPGGSNCHNCKLGKHISLSEPFSMYDVQFGDYSYVAPYSHISMATIGKFCSIGPHFLCGWGIHPTDGISTSPMFYSLGEQNGMTLSKENKIAERKLITIGNDVFIGANVTVLDGVSIGDGAVIGAGAVVSKDIPPYAVAMGNPIKVHRYRFSEKQINALRRIEWWNREEILSDVEGMFFDVEGFIKKYDSEEQVTDE